MTPKIKSQLEIIERAKNILHTFNEPDLFKAIEYVKYNLL